MKDKLILIDEKVALEVIGIFSHAINESTDHIRRILLGHKLSTHYCKITLRKAVRRRRFCKGVVSRALRGFIL